jgi:hypothetical protein
LPVFPCSDLRRAEAGATGDADGDALGVATTPRNAMVSPVPKRVPMVPTCTSPLRMR